MQNKKKDIPFSMQPGEQFASRFTIKKLAGRGAAGEVYCAYDHKKKLLVALKILQSQNESEIEDFMKEAWVLATLSHPGIVQYIAHGKTQDEKYYLAMQWLEGETLRQRLRRKPLCVSESVTLCGKIAEALSVAHSRGVVHRDIKPSNLFLPEGSLSRVTLLDFGLARFGKALRSVSKNHPGVIEGTPKYMAPEQARGEQEIFAPCVDVFSLGCVLFECLTGRPAFQGKHITAVLAKVLLEEVPKASSLCAEVSPALDSLIERMLSKNPDNRPKDGSSLLRELSLLAEKEGEQFVSTLQHLEALTEGERRLLCVLLITASVASKGKAPLSNSSIIRRQKLQTIRNIAARYGGRVEPLADGSLVITVWGTRVATDQAKKASRLALHLQEMFPDSVIILATGRGQIGPWPVGEVLDRAVKIARSVANTENSFRKTPIWLCRVSAPLLESNFLLYEEKEGFLLHKEKPPFERGRTLLGLPSPYVGRQKELQHLEEIFAKSCQELTAHSILITAPVGMGKSRLCQEFLSCVRQKFSSITVFFGNGDPMRARAPFALLSRSLKRFFGMQDRVPLFARQQKLSEYIKSIHSFSPDDQQRVTEFLGELLGIPFSAENGVRLKAARQDARLMGDQMLRAFLDFLQNECSKSPVLFIVEDLHWGDLPTIQFLEAALRHLSDSPLVVLALARPEIHEAFSSFWEETNFSKISLENLNKIECQTLVQQTLGQGVSEEIVEELIERSGGNAFYLEELVRVIAEGKDDALPESILAMAQARLERLPEKARQLLRAASIFGQEFWEEGVQRLLGEKFSEKTSKWLLFLLEEEVLAVHEIKHGEEERIYSFRHAFLQEVSYLSLTEQDRTLGHRLAAIWLLEVDKKEPVVLAEHFERSGELLQAIPWYQRAAEQALEGNDLSNVLALAEKAIHCGALENTLGELCLLQSTAYNWRGEFAETALFAEKAICHLERASVSWFNASGEAMIAYAKQGEIEKLISLGNVLSALQKKDPGGAQIRAMARGAIQLYLTGQYPLAEKIHAWIETLPDPISTFDSSVAARIAEMRAFRAMIILEDIAMSIHWNEMAAGYCEQAGDLRNSCAQRVDTSFRYLEVGFYQKAEQSMQEVLLNAEYLGSNRLLSVAKIVLGASLERQEKLSLAEKIEREASEALFAQGDRRMGGISRTYLARILWKQGKLSEGLTEARLAVELLATIRPFLARALATLSNILRASGNVDEALSTAQKAHDLLEKLGKVGLNDSIIRLSYVEALLAKQQQEKACQFLLRAQNHLLSRANKFRDTQVQKSFLGVVEENVRTLSLGKTFLSHNK